MEILVEVKYSFCYHKFYSAGHPNLGANIFVVFGGNGPEFTAKVVRKWLSHLEVKTLFIEPGSPWENDYIESFNGKLRDELLNREIFTTLEEAKVLIGQWRKEYNQVRPHSALGHWTPAPETILVGATT
jgi:transposase InsO family protein